MADIEIEYHKKWLGMVEPIEGLVVSVPVLCDAQCMNRLPPEVQRRLTTDGPDGPALSRKLPDQKDGRSRRELSDLRAFFTKILDLTPDLFDGPDVGGGPDSGGGPDGGLRGAPLPDDLCLYVPEGQETLRPTLALRKLRPDGSAAPSRDPAPGAPSPEPGASPDETPAGRAGAAYVMLVLDLPGVPLSEPDRREGFWAYPPQAKFDRLLRHCHVPIGLLTNRQELRLLYAPHGESSGVLTFRVGDMADSGGREILDALVMLLSARRFFGVAREHQLPRILRDSRQRQANVTNELAEQVLDALQVLLRGFQAAAERDGADLLRDALRKEPDGQHLYGGLLTVLLRMVFLLYAEDRGLLPMTDALYAQHLSVLTLFGQLQADHGAFPDTMSRRFGAWPRLLALFRAIYGGAHHGALHLPARHGELFNPGRYPFLEGWEPVGAAPWTPEDRADLRVPTVDDQTVFLVLHRLLLLSGQRLSYRALDVEQIGSVYEALMGFQVREVAAPALCLRPRRIWLTTDEVRQQGARLSAYLTEEIGVPRAAAQKLQQAAAAARDDDDEGILSALLPQAVRGIELARAGHYVLQPGPERRRTSSHYTPRSLSAPIVRRTLEPLLSALGPAPSSELLLGLKVCDPAMGSGAFLVEACRFLADQVVAAWTREGAHDRVAAASDDVVNRARRLVAQRCLYGVDKNPFAVSLAKLSLWLLTLAHDEPFTFVDHALRHGDSLVGLGLDDLRAFHWKQSKQQELFKEEIDAALDEALGFRQRILSLAGEHGDAASWEKERLLRDAEFALDRARAIGDLLVGAFFAHEKDKEREKERNRRLDAVVAWLREDGEMPEALQALRDGIKEQVPVFHWMLEFPEVFYAGRPDPLAGGQVNEAAYFDAFVGNPPFSGKNGISEAGGTSYLPWLQTVHQGAHGNADLSAHFFRRADALLGEHGAIGLIATNTIAQGDTRATGLRKLVQDGLVIYDATRSMIWPGDASVAVSVVHLAKGSAVSALGPERRLNGLLQRDINSRLRPKPERLDPVVLGANAEKSFQGSIVLGMGFTLTPEERDALVARDARNGERIFPYLGGEEVNTSPTQSFDRYVISFGGMPLEEAECWPDLIDIVRRKVKPERDKNNRDTYRINWWQFGEKRPALYEAIAPLKRCLVTARVTKHLCMSFQPTDRILNEKLYVFPFEAFAHFALLQSRVHGPWAWMLSSTMKNDLNYSASDCFETFPFPEKLGSLEDIGQRLYTARADFMSREQKGLTQTYNLLKDPSCDEAAIVSLRALHEDLDRAVLAAYLWDDIPVPPFVSPTTPDQEKAREAFQDEVIDRLFDLNARRADEERLLGAGKARGKKPPGSPAPAPADPAPLTLTAQDGRPRRP